MMSLILPRRQFLGDLAAAFAAPAIVRAENLMKLPPRRIIKRTVGMLLPDGGIYVHTSGDILLPPNPQPGCQVIVYNMGQGPVTVYGCGEPFLLERCRGVAEVFSCTERGKWWHV